MESDGEAGVCLDKAAGGVMRERTLWEVDERGEAGRLGVIRGRGHGGFVVESGTPVAGEYQGLPWFLQGMRLSGFLGRLRARDTGVGQDIREWSAETVLEWAERYGWDVPGNLVIGDALSGRSEPSWMLENFGGLQEDAVSISSSGRSFFYPRIADLILEAGAISSSAAGEQPKFLAIRDDQPVLVKFSPPLDSALGRRVGDLLWCEKLALEAVAEEGIAAARAEIVEAGGRGSERRLFLEVERFDRLPGGGRRGVVSLEAASMEFSGGLASWSETMEDLRGEGRVSAADCATAGWLESFGHCIGNDDMHHGNLSLWFGRGRLGGLAPVYDMLPMRFMPRHNEVPRAVTLEIPAKVAALVAAHPGARAAAGRFWGRAAAHPEISPGFREIAARAAERIGGSR